MRQEAPIGRCMCRYLRFVHPSRALLLLRQNPCLAFHFIV